MVAVATTTTTILLVTVVVLITFLLYCVIRTYQEDRRYEHHNATEWKIDALPWPAYWVRCFNAVVGSNGWLISLLLQIIDNQLVQPALRRSLELMEQADHEGNVPKILCGRQARIDMTNRLSTFYKDIQQSQTLTAFAKILNYSTSHRCLTHHYGLLKLGMQPAVAISERVVEPVFIVSAPRTCTTILHRTMAKDKRRFRNFDLCDMVGPLSPPSSSPVPRWDEQGRTELAKQMQKDVMDTFQSIYPGINNCMEKLHHAFRLDEADEQLRWYDYCIGHVYLDVVVKLGWEMRQSKNNHHRHHPLPLETKEVAAYRYAWLDMIMRIYQHVDKSEWTKRQQQQKQKVCNNNNNNNNNNTSNGHNGKSTNHNGDDTNNNDSSISYAGPCPTEHLPWLMKDPTDPAHLTELYQQFPDAKFIFIHRNPALTTPSMAKVFVCFSCVEHRPGVPGTTARDWGRESLTRMQDYVNGIVKFTKEQQQQQQQSSNNNNNNGGGCGDALVTQQIKVGGISNHNGDSINGDSKRPPRRRLDFQFQDVVTDIPGTIETIYQDFYPNQPGPSKTVQQEFDDYLKINALGKNGNQSRTLNDFHLTKEDISAAFAEYNEMFLSDGTLSS